MSMRCAPQKMLAFQDKRVAVDEFDVPAGNHQQLLYWNHEQHVTMALAWTSFDGPF